MNSSFAGAGPARSQLPALNASDVAEILRHIPARPPYPDWIKIIGAVGSVLPDDEAAGVLAAWSEEEIPGEYQAKLRSKLSEVGIGSLILMAKQHGFDATAFTRTRFAIVARRAPKAAVSSMIRKPPQYTPRPGGIDELCTLADLRKLRDPEGLDAMQSAGCLAFADDLNDVNADRVWRPVKAWLVLDPTRRNISARRLDGLGWNCLNGAKSRCLSGPGSKNWPVGLLLAKPGQRLDIVEGEGDLVALWHLHSRAKATDAAPVGLLGSCVNIGPLAAEIRPWITGRMIQIFAHRDTTGTGQTAALRWSDWFYRLGAASVYVRDLSKWLGQTGKDLNDAVAEDNTSAALVEPQNA